MWLTFHPRQKPARFRADHQARAAFSLVELLIGLVSLSLLSAGVYRSLIKQQTALPHAAIEEKGPIWQARRQLNQIKEKIEASGFNPLMTPSYNLNQQFFSSRWNDVTHDHKHTIGFLKTSKEAMVFTADRVDSSGVEGNYDGLINVPPQSEDKSFSEPDFTNLQLPFDARETTIFFCGNSETVFRNKDYSALALYTYVTAPSTEGKPSAKRISLLDNLAYCQFSYTTKSGRPLSFRDRDGSILKDTLSMSRICDLKSVTIAVMLLTEKPIPGYKFPKLSETGLTEDDWQYQFYRLIENEGGDYGATLLSATAEIRNPCPAPIPIN